MKPQTKIYIALIAAAVLAIGMLGGHLWSNHKIAKLERETEAAKQAADGSRRAAEQREIEAAGYQQKIDYLERQLTDVQTIARKQDETLEKLNNDSRRARANVDTARRARAINTTNDELCTKLAELGHPCSE